MKSQEENLKDLVKIGFLKFLDGAPLRENISEEAIEKLKKLECGENSVLVLGYAKTGNHFLLQILHHLGYQRLYGETDGESLKRYVGYTMI